VENLAGSIKGIAIEIGGETQKLTDALKGIVSESRGLQSELKQVDRLLKFNPGNAELLAQKQEILAEALEKSKEKMETLREAERQLEDRFQRGDLTAQEYREQHRALQREILFTENRMEDLQRQQEQCENAMRHVGDSVEELAEDLEDAGDSASSFSDTFKGAFLGGSLAGAIQSIAGSVSSLVSETLEYRKIVGTLETSSKKAGYTAEETAASYKQLYGVLGDEQSAATALANLQALGLEQDQLQQVTEAAIGAWATYGDSIPIDGLAEAINETIQAGQVTGTFADVLNWAGTSEDDFNTALEACQDKASRVNLVMQELANQGLAETADAWRQNNDDIVAMQEAELDLKDATAEFGEIATPIIATVKQGLADMLHGLMDLLRGSAPVAPLLASIASGIAGLKLGSFISNILTTTKNIGSLKGAFTLLSAAFRANPIGVVISLIAALAAGLVTAYQTNEKFRNVVDQAWKTIKTTVVNCVNGILDTLKSLPSIFSQAGKKMMRGILDGMQSVWNSISSWVSEKIRWLTDKLSFWRSGQNEMSKGSTLGGGAGRRYNGSHANGLPYVPFDGYIAQLHQGEAVLTKQEAQVWRGGEEKQAPQIHVTQHIYSPTENPAEAQRIATREFRRLALEV